MSEEFACRGEVLTLVGVDDVDSLDPALAYHTVTRNLMRCLTRQLVSYSSGVDPDRAGDIACDLASVVPSRDNGLIDSSGCEITFPLRPEIYWDDGRPVCAGDVVRGIKRLADPRRPSPGLAYYTETLLGMREFQAEVAHAEASEVAALLERTALAGAEAVDEQTVQIRTTSPTSDLFNLLALPFASPAPEEYLSHIPGSAEMLATLRSCGPYALDHYRAKTLIRLVRNPFWSSEADPLRPAWVDGVEVRQGYSEQQAHDLVLQGEAHLLWDTQPLTAELPGLLSSRDPRLEVYPAGLLSPYLVVNFDGDERAAPLRDQRVRQAVQFAINKAETVRVWGGEQLATIARQLLPSTCSAHVRRDFYVTADDRGDPHRARDLLAQAGYRSGELSLRLVHRDSDIHPETAEVVGASLEAAGFGVELIPTSTAGLFDDYLADPGTARGWDLALTGWEPDWHGNNVRTYLVPLLDSRGEWGSNFGHYRNVEVNRLLDRALTAADPAQAKAAFLQVECLAMEDAAIVPILFAHQYWMHSAAVRNWRPYPVLNGDLTHMWLSDKLSPADEQIGNGHDHD